MTLEQIKSIPLPSTAFAMKGPVWVVASDYLCVQGTKVYYNFEYSDTTDIIFNVVVMA